MPDRAECCLCPGRGGGLSLIRGCGLAPAAAKQKTGGWEQEPGLFARNAGCVPGSETLARRRGTPPRILLPSPGFLLSSSTAAQCPGSGTIHRPAPDKDSILPCQTPRTPAFPLRAAPPPPDLPLFHGPALVREGRREGRRHRRGSCGWRMYVEMYNVIVDIVCHV